MTKPKVAFYWCASCGGCEETVVDLGEAILDVVQAVDIVFWPVALDFKYKDVEALDDGAIAVSFINGAIRTSEQEEVARLLRRKSQLVVAFGACAASGGIPALANLTSREAIFRTAYHDVPALDNPEGTEPRPSSTVGGHEVRLPEIYPTVYRLADVIEVDYTIPGCPPPSALLASAVGAILKGELPPRGSVLAPDKALCVSCDRNASKPDEVYIDRIRRVVDTELRPDLCFLAQGVICMGPATRDGCGQACISGNMPCTGCFGPTSNCRDQGGKMMAALGGILRASDEKQLDSALEALVDPAGTFYRYTLSASLVGSHRKDKD